MKISGKTIMSLQALRAVAALMVAIYHLSVYRNGAEYQNNWLFGGKLGVDFFFVLSGFIILYAHVGDIGRPSILIEYVVKRLLRIYPIYWLITAMVAVQAIHAGDTSLSLRDWISTITLVRFDSFNTFVDVSWSLFHEIIFYVFFATMIINYRLGVAIFSVWFLAVIATHTYFIWGQWGFYQTLLGAYNLYFFFGMAVFFLFRKLPRWLVTLLFFSALAILAELTIHEHANGENLSFRLLYGVSFACILLGFTRWDADGLIRTPSVFILTGNASYVLYLTHLPTMRMMRHLGKHLAPGLMVSYWVVIPSATIVAVVIHQVIEKPLLQWARSGFAWIGFLKASSLERFQETQKRDVLEELGSEATRVF